MDQDSSKRCLGEVRIPLDKVKAFGGMLYHAWLILDTMNDTMPSVSFLNKIIESSCGYVVLV